MKEYVSTETSGSTLLPLSPAEGEPPVLATPVMGRSSRRVRSPEQDRRVAVHESGHLVAGLLCGREGGMASIDPSAVFAGLCWWGAPDANCLNVNAMEDELVETSRKIREAMPELGSRECAAPLYPDVLEEITNLMAGKAAEMLFCDGPTPEPASDLRKAHALAAQICRSERSVEAMVNWGLAEATGLLQQHHGAVLAIADALLKQRTLDNTDEIAKIVALGMARQYQEEERARRERWRRIEQSAAAFAESITKNE